MNAQEIQLENMTLGEIAAKIPGATSVFRRYDLDFCCAGNRVLTEAVTAKKLEKAAVIKALQDIAVLEEEPLFPMPETDEDYQILTSFIVERFHNRHRHQFPELILLAQKIERVHAANADCPAGLAKHLEGLYQELSAHMQKEEDVLFPLLCRGEREQAQEIIEAIESEHTEHGEGLQKIRDLTQNIETPEGACNSWRALYQGLAALEDDLIGHIHTENNILFAR